MGAQAPGGIGGDEMRGVEADIQQDDQRSQGQDGDAKILYRFRDGRQHQHQQDGPGYQGGGIEEPEIDPTVVDDVLV